MKSHLSKKSENLSYIAKITSMFLMSIVHPIMITVFVPVMAQYAIPAGTMVTALLDFITQRGFALNAVKPNLFGAMLKFTRRNLMEVMMLNLVFIITNIGALYYFPTAGFITLPLAGGLNLFIDQSIYYLQE